MRALAPKALSGQLDRQGTSMPISRLALVSAFLIACGSGTNPSATAPASPESLPDAGNPASFADCEGLIPGPSGTPTQIRLTNIDLVDDGCGPGDVDGTGKIALFCNGLGDRGGIYLAGAADGKVTGPFAGEGGNAFAGQAEGFINGNCTGGACFVDTYGVDDSGAVTFRNQGGVTHAAEVNNPAGGAVRADFGAEESETATVQSFDAQGNIRWSRVLPEPVSTLALGADRAGNVLALWKAPAAAGDLLSGDTKAQWFDPLGNPGPGFVAFSGQHFAGQMFERVSSGLFVQGIVSSDGGASFSHVWLGQLDAFSTSVLPAPSWLISRPGVSLHMAHGGTAYAVLPQAGISSSDCSQEIEIISAAGNRCGATSFAAVSTACTTSAIIVGYDGTVVQQLPQEEFPCDNSHFCTVGFQAWPGFFK
jgi:hypothetical protein